MRRKTHSGLIHHCILEALEDRRLFSADLGAGFKGKIPLALPVQGSTTLTVSVMDVGGAAVNGSATVALYASADGVLDATDTFLGFKTSKVKLTNGKSVSFAVKFSSPTMVADGNYFILANAVDGTTVGDVASAVNVGKTPLALHITKPVLDLTDSVTTVPKKPITIAAVKPKPTALSVTVNAAGNVSAMGNLKVDFYFSADQTLDAGDPLAESGVAKINIKVGHPKLVTIKKPLSANIPTGNFFIIARLNSDQNLTETDLTNNVAVSSSTVAIINPAIPAGPFMLGGLTSDTPGVITGQASLVHFSAHVSQPTPQTAVEVDEVDGQGNFIGKITDLFDNGSAAVGDPIAGDGLFNGLSSIEIDTAGGARHFVAVLTDPSVAGQQSVALTITAADPPDAAEIQADDADLQTAGGAAGAVLGAGGSANSAVMAADAAIVASGNFIPGSIVTSPTAIQWESTDGCMYFIDANLLDSSDGGDVENVAASTDTAPTIVAADEETDNGGTAISIAPFQSIMVTNGVELAADASTMLSDAGFTVTNFFDAAGTLDAFKNLGQYDAIVIHTHGGHLPGGGEALLTSEQPTVGTDLTNAFDLYINHRLIKAYNPDNNTQYYCVTNNFISAYSGSMDHTIVFAGACHSAEDTELADAFLNNGAAAFIGFTGTVTRSVDNNDGVAAFTTLLKTEDNTVGDIPNIDTFDDPPHPTTEFIEYGDSTATLPHGNLLRNNDLYVNYNWPQTQSDLDSNTNFLGVSVGYNLSSSPYLHWSGDDTSAGGTEVTTVDLYQAWQDIAWSNSTEVTAGADWYTPAGGSGPAFITIALKNKTTGAFTHVSSFTVAPGQETSGAQTVLETVLVTLTGNLLDPSVHIAVE